MTKKFQREFKKEITDRLGYILHDYHVGGKHYLCKILCEGCEIHSEPTIFPKGKGTSISTSPSASNAWKKIRSQIKKVHRENGHQ